MSALVKQALAWLIKATLKVKPGPKVDPVK